MLVASTHIGFEYFQGSQGFKILHVIFDRVNKNSRNFKICFIKITSKCQPQAGWIEMFPFIFSKQKGNKKTPLICIVCEN